LRYWIVPLGKKRPLNIGGEEGEKTRKRRFRINLSSGFEEPALNLSTLQRKGFHVLEEKSDLRRRLLEKRLSLNRKDVWIRSDDIKRSLIKLKSFQEARCIALYYPIKNEVGTQGIFKIAKELGKGIYFPLVDGSSLEFRKINNLAELKIGRFDVPEPSHCSPGVEIEDIDLIIIPGIAFDSFGVRIGYGKGYYDRAISKIDIKKRVGLAYNFQVVESIPIERYDVRVGLIVTETGVIIC